MEKLGSIEIRVRGKSGNLEINPDNYDIREIKSMLENAEKLLFPESKKSRPNVSYRIEEGSVRHVFTTEMQTVIGFNAVIGQLAAEGNTDFLSAPTAEALESIQEMAYKKDYDFEIQTSVAESSVLSISKNTGFTRSESIWVDAEFYFYGKITNAGGKGAVNMHINTEEYGTLIIDTPKKFLTQYEDNILYKSFGIRAVGKQNATTGEIDKKSLRFLELVDHHKSYDKNYLKSLRKKARDSWIGKVDPDEWLNDLRNDYE